MIHPGATLGVVGGGQLGRMFTVRAREMGYRVLDPDIGSPAGSIADRHLAAEYHDSLALDELADACRAVTVEFENVPAGVLERLADRVIVRPSAAAVAIAQDRTREKQFIRDHGFPTAEFHPVASLEDLAAAWPRIGSPALLKTARLGYDGKGQASVDSLAGAQAAFLALGRECILERRIGLEREISVVLARGADGAIACYPPGENVHVDGILSTTTVPARVSPTVVAEADEIARALAEALRYVGVLGVEMFVAEGGRLFVNELAPRPHNSGHYTLDACVTDQFEQQVRTLAALPLGSPRLLTPVTMLNLLGDLWRDGPPPWDRLLALPGVKLHLYGKRHARPGRKMGHATCLAESAEAAAALARRAMEVLSR
jgi:5-(carboxyamino)imidazole ribonucleotide synthase